MHLPNGALCPYTCLATAALSAGALVVAAERLRRERRRPAASTLAAAAFGMLAAQALNVPIGGGMSGHVLGGLAVACVVGPWAGMLVTAAVLTVQCLAWGDGGITALGANVFNMAVVGCGVGYALFAALRRRLPGSAGCVVAAALAGWCSVILAATACAIELATGGAISLSSSLATVAASHVVVGLLESVATMVVAAALLSPTGNSRGATAPRAVGSMLLLLLVAGGLFSSALPDALETSLHRLGLRQNDTVKSAVTMSADGEFKAE
jgi:cobalt/nickel transport system permease protein